MLVGCFAATLLSAGPAAADVNCADLPTQGVAQSYFDGRAGDPDRLDGDADGRACESNDPQQQGGWLLVLLAVLMAGGLVRYAVDSDVQSRKRPARAPVQLVPVQVSTRAEHAPDDASPVPTQKQVVVSQASTGSITELARALRLVPYAGRMKLLEEHARAHGSEPQDVLDTLADHTTDLELQGWALAGYDPPWFVRPMHCDCVDGLRNYRLQKNSDGTRFWACSSCHQPVHTTT